MTLKEAASQLREADAQLNKAGGALLEARDKLKAAEFAYDLARKHWESAQRALQAAALED